MADSGPHRSVDHTHSRGAEANRWFSPTLPASTWQKLRRTVPALNRPRLHKFRDRERLPIFWSNFFCTGRWDTHLPADIARQNPCGANHFRAGRNPRSPVARERQTFRIEVPSRWENRVSMWQEPEMSNLRKSFQFQAKSTVRTPPREPIGNFCDFSEELLLTCFVD